MFVSLLPYPSSFLFLFSYFSCYFFIDFPQLLPFEEGRFLFFFFSVFPYEYPILMLLDGFP